MIVKVDAANGAYEIRIGKGLLDNDIINGYKNYTVITDKNVFPLYAHFFDSERCIVLEAGEQSKSLANYELILESLLRMDLDRQSAVVALGGGVVGDIAGFAAATFKRGVPLIQVPTTLLAQVDSSVGGKVAVNLPQGKNMAGAFYQPSLVIADTQTLDTLDERQYAAGMAEVIKYAYIANEGLHEDLQKKDYQIEDVIAQCCKIKAKYVEEDPYDTGIRMQLNYGHTIGHAIEAAAGYGAYLHGEAVAIGMMCAAYIGERIGLSPKGLAEDTAALVALYDLPANTDNTILEEAVRYIKTDKKAEGGYVHFILIDRIGHAVIEKIEVGEIETMMKEYAAC